MGTLKNGIFALCNMVRKIVFVNATIKLEIIQNNSGLKFHYAKLK